MSAILSRIVCPEQLLHDIVDSDDDSDMPTSTTSTQSVEDVDATDDVVELWNGLPDIVLSNVLSYLTTKQVIQLRSLNRVWNKVGQLPTSFNRSTARGDILVLKWPGKYTMAGVKAVAVHVCISLLHDWWSFEGQPLSCLSRCQALSIDTIVSTRIAQTPDMGFEYPCRLTAVCESPIRDQLRCLRFYIESRKEDWKALAAAPPLQQLTEFHSRWEDDPTSDSWPALTHLMPNLVTLHITCTSRTLANLQPILQLPNLAELVIKTLQRTNDLRSTVRRQMECALEVFGSDMPACKLRRLQLVGDDNFQRALVEDQHLGLGQMASDVMQLSLYNVEHRQHFSAHLACLTSITSLELIATSHILPEHADCRQRLLDVLPQLPQLRTLRLLVEDWSTCYSGTFRVDWLTEYQPQEHEEQRLSDQFRAARWADKFPTDYIAYRPWSLQDLTALFTLPLDELTVQHLTPTAGQALKVLAEAESMTLRRLKLGITSFPYDTVVTVANKLEQLQLPDSSRSRLPECQQVLAMLPPTITFFSNWSD